MPQVLNVSEHGKETNDEQVFVGRPSKWGNPFVIGPHGNRDQVIAKYEYWLVHSHLYRQLYELTGKNLVCFCSPQKCHADILLVLAADACPPETWREE